MRLLEGILSDFFFSHLPNPEYFPCLEHFISCYNNIYELIFLDIVKMLSFGWRELYLIINATLKFRVLNGLRKIFKIPGIKSVGKNLHPNNIFGYTSIPINFNFSASLIYR